MNILIRCDSSFEIGSGHAVRCLAIATQLKKMGHHVDFACIPFPGSQNQWFRSQSFTVLEPSDQSTSLDWIPSGKQYDCCIIDQYSLDSSYENRLRTVAKKLVAIDDWGERSHSVDLIIDPSISGNSIRRKNKNPNTPFYSGADWTLLREEFARGHLKTGPRTHFEKVMVFFGGTDPADQTKAYYDFLTKTNSSLQFYFLIGPQHPRLSEFKSLSPPPFIHFHFSPSNVSDFMSEMDLYIGSSGTISWERTCLGLTGLIISIVDNQEEIAQNLHDQHLHIYLGRHQVITPEFVYHQLIETLKDQSVFKEMSKKSYNSIDGQGFSRIVNLITQLS